MQNSGESSRENESVCFPTVIASEAKQSSFLAAAGKKAGLLRRYRSSQ